MEEKALQLYPGWDTVRRIGSGSFGMVYEIRRELFGREERAALKHIPLPQEPGDVDALYEEGYDAEGVTAHFQEALEDIVREYTLMTRLKGHPNVVCCDDFFHTPREDGIGWDIYIKMELLTPLSKALPPQITDETVIRLGKDICNALIQCEKQGILHRDIKPQNIFMSGSGSFKLGDFGIAKTVEKTMGGTKTGTSDYMAPEVAAFQPYGFSADVYSLGLVLYWMLNRQRLPFLPLPPEKIRPSALEKSRTLRCSGKPLPPPDQGSEELKQIVRKACAFAPRDRYASAQELLDALVDLEDLPRRRALEEEKRRQEALEQERLRKEQLEQERLRKEQQKQKRETLLKTLLPLLCAAVLVAVVSLIPKGSPAPGEPEPTVDVQPETPPTSDSPLLEISRNYRGQIQRVIFHTPDEAVAGWWESTFEEETGIETQRKFYTNAGQLLAEVDLKPDGSFDALDCHMEQLFCFYNPAGDILLSSHFIEDDLVSGVCYEYMDVDNPFAAFAPDILWTEKTDVLREFDGSGKLLWKELFRDYAGSGRTVYEYDASGRLTQILNKDSYGDLNYREDVTWDEQTGVETRTSLDSRGNAFYTQNFVYGPEERIYLEEQISEEGGRSIVLYTYFTDADGRGLSCLSIGYCP